MRKRFLSVILAAVLMLSVCSSMTAFAKTDYTIREGEVLAVMIAKEGETSVAFTPDKTGLYRLTSDAAGSLDPELDIYIGKDYCITAEDIGQENYNFDITFYFTEGTDYALYLTEYEGNAASFNITAEFVSPVDSVEFTPADDAYIYYENTGVYPDFMTGDTITVTLEDGTQLIFEYDEDYGGFYNSESEYSIEYLFGEVPVLEPLLDEDTDEFLNRIQFCFLDCVETYDVTVTESPVASISYKPAEPYVLIEKVSGVPIEDDEGEEIFLYFLELNAGDVLTVKYKDGTTERFTLCVEEYEDEDVSYEETVFLNSDGEPLDYRYYTLDQFGQVSQPWQLGENYFTVYYYDCECRVPVHVIKPGWFTDGNKKYYYNRDGEKLTGWQTIGGKKYLFAYADGRMLTGWYKSGKNKYYFGSDGAMRTGWQNIDGKKYLFAYADGRMLTGWYKSSKNKYCFGSDGAMLTGWQTIGGKKYLFAYADGRMLTGWYKSGKYKYYFGSDGAMRTGWQTIGGKRYLFAYANGRMLTGWYKSGKNKYYFGADGAMVVNRSLKIGNKTYKFNKNGVCTNP